MRSKRFAVVTGASSGIGAATCERLVAEGFDVLGGARRLDRLQQLASNVGPGLRIAALDVTSPESVDAFCSEIERCDVLVNNAGGALGLEPVVEAVDEKWLTMYETNVMGVMRMTRALMPKLIESGDGHVVSIGSVAGIETYSGGGGYNAAKHALRAVMDVMRLELLGKPVRISEVDPGMVETEFSFVRFEGDAQRANRVYEGMTPLSAADIADCIAFVVTRPSHVDIDQIVVRPRDQARVGVVHRSDRSQ